MSISSKIALPNTGRRMLIASAVQYIEGADPSSPSSGPLLVLTPSPQSIAVYRFPDIQSPLSSYSISSRLEHLTLGWNGPNELNIVGISSGNLFFASVGSDGLSNPLPSNIASSETYSVRKKRPHPTASTTEPAVKKSAPFASSAGASTGALHSAPTLLPLSYISSHSKIIDAFPLPNGILCQSDGAPRHSIVPYQSSARRTSLLTDLASHEKLTFAASLERQISKQKSSSSLLVLPDSLLRSLHGNQFKDSDYPLLIAGTGQGRVIVAPQNDSSAPPLLDLVQLTSSSVISICPYALQTRGVAVLIFGSKGELIVLTEQPQGGFRTRRFHLSLSLSHVCLLSNYFAFLSDGTPYYCEIRSSPTFSISKPSKLNDTTRAHSLLRISATQVATLDSNNTLTTFELHNSSALTKKALRNPAQAIGRMLERLAQLSDDQAKLSELEPQIDSLIAQLNAMIHVGALKAQFAVRITPKIDFLTDSPSLSLQIAVVCPSIIAKLKHWALVISVSQGSLTSSFSVPLEHCHRQERSSTSISLSHRFQLRHYSSDIMYIRTYICFHTYALLEPLQETKPERLTAMQFVSESSEKENATLFIGESFIDALDLLECSKYQVAWHWTPHSFFQILDAIFARTRAPLQQLTRQNDLSQQEVKIGSAVFGAKTEWKDVPSDLIQALFGGPLYQAIMTRALRSKGKLLEDRGKMSIAHIIAASSDANGKTSEEVLTSPEATALHASSIVLRLVRAPATSGSVSTLGRMNGLQTDDFSATCQVQVRGEVQQASLFRAALFRRLSLLPLRNTSSPTKHVLSRSAEIQNLWHMILQLSDELNAIKVKAKDGRHHISQLDETLQSASSFLASLRLVYSRLRSVVTESFVV